MATRQRRTNVTKEPPATRLSKAKSRGSVALALTNEVERAERFEAPRRKRDGDATRARILDVAIREFAANGFNGARIEAIARLASANPRMIYHFFVDKAGLYVAVLENVLGELRREELKLEIDHVAPIEGMMALFHFIHRHFARHGELISLLSGENLLEARFLKRSTETPLEASPLIALIESLLQRGEASGDFRRGIDPLILYVAMVSLSYFHRSNVHTLSAIFRRDLGRPGWQAAQRRLAEDMIRRTLLREPGEGQ